jgi:hypothetical protein
MLPSGNFNLAGSQTQTASSHAVWGDIRRTAALGVLLLFAACHLALAGSKLSNGDLKAFRSSQIMTRSSRPST